MVLVGSKDDVELTMGSTYRRRIVATKPELPVTTGKEYNSCLSNSLKDTPALCKSQIASRAMILTSIIRVYQRRKGID